MFAFNTPEIQRRRLPSFRPAVVRLEDRLAPTMLQYAASFQFLAQDGVYQQVGTAFQWDTQSMQCASALQTAGQYAGGTQNAIQAWNAMTDNGDGTLNVMGATSVCGLTPDSGESNVNAVNSIALSQNFDYTSSFDLSGVTIDSSVHDDASAYARAVSLKATAVAALQENISILKGIQLQYAQGNNLTAACQYLYYSPQLQHNQAVAARAQKELSLIKAQYGSGVFK